MTIDELVKARNGVWENGFAVVTDQSGYYWRVAEGTPENHKVLVDAARFGIPAAGKLFEAAASDVLANTKASDVQSSKRRVVKKAPPPPSTPGNLDLGDLDI